MNILIVEDDVDVQESYRFYLKGENLSFAKESKKALKLFEIREFDLAICDFQLLPYSELNGFQLAMIFKEKIPVCMCSGSDHAMLLAHQNGIPFLQKHLISRQNLPRLIEDTLHGH